MRLDLRLRSLAVIGLAGCAHASAPPTSEPVRPEVQLCKTTSAELEQRLGRPYRDGQVHRWHIQSFMLSQRGERESFLAVALDADGVVHDVYYDVPGAISWTPEDQCPAK
jgi:hypothetical protein